MPFAERDLGTKDLKVFTPQSLKDAEEIILYMKTQSFILNVSALKPQTAQRLIDLLTGASCALNKHICVLDNNNYLFLE